LAHYDKPDYSKLMCLEWSKGVFMKRANSAQKGIRLYHPKPQLKAPNIGRTTR